MRSEISRYALAISCACASMTASGQGYTLQPGDMVQLRCDDPRLCVTRKVSANGVIEVPGLGYVVAVDMDMTKLGDRLGRLIWDRSGSVRTIVARGADSPDAPIRVEGLVEDPFSRRWHAGLGLREILKDASFRPEAERRFVKLIAADGTTIEVDTATGPDTRLRPGDHVEVGLSRESNEVVVVGAVIHPGAVEAAPGLTLAKAISLSGGLAGNANSGRVTIKGSDGRTRIVELAQAADLPLFRGDEIGIAVTETHSHITVSGAIAHPGIVEFLPGMTLTEALSAAGGLKKGSGDVVVVTRILDKRMRSTTYHLNRILSKLETDPALSAEDSIVVGGFKR